MPKVSVIIPTYNRSGYLLEAIESVCQQTYRDFEIVVVDDGSTDNTREVLDHLIDEEMIRYFYQEKSNQSAARNYGVSKARGEYIAFLDSDDLFVSSKLEKQVAFLDEHPEVGFVHSWYSKFDDAGNHLGVRDTSRYSGNIYPEILLSWSVLMAVPCMMMRVEVFREVCGFDENQCWGEDLDLWRRIARHYPIDLIPEVLTKVRVHPGNVSNVNLKPLIWFDKFLQLAFEDDPSLGLIFKRKVAAKLYTNVAHNNLGESSKDLMAQIRILYAKAIKNWPFGTMPYVGLFITILPASFRLFLLNRYRVMRNLSAQGS